ncbi:MAG: hypothetical protein K0R09_1139 [Clostridiales bacterium]|jgi:flavin reductase (DIM6/NTAB) family NADH-FMN oxidoreductase RutF|nr:hypothetical protein [Clostridiales bacterium]
MKKSISPEPFFPAMPVVIVATKDGDNINFAPHGMSGQLNYDPPLLYVSVIKNHMTAKIISKTKKFSVNIPNTEVLKKIKYCGSVSGAEVDKSKEFDVFYGKKDVPMILKCPVNMCCEVYETIEIKDMIVFVGQVTEAFADEECLLDDMPLATKVDPLICTIQGKYYKMGREIE